MMFSSRIDAGRRLARRLAPLRSENPVILALPRGGVPVAYEVARELDAPLDVIVVRKLGIPFQPEVAMGAIGENDVRVVNEQTVIRAGVSTLELASVEKREREELRRRVHRYRAGRARVPIEGRVVIIVDDGVATGSTAMAACEVARAEGATRVVLAVPVAPSGWEDRFAGAADEMICLKASRQFRSVGQFYEHFGPTLDEEVVEYLDLATQENFGMQGVSGGAGVSYARSEEVGLQVGGTLLRGQLTVPHLAHGLVIFAHGSGSSRHSPRNRFVASILNESGLATLLFDLLSEDEAVSRTHVFDIELLSRRLVQVAGWAQGQEELRGLPVGYFGASTGAAAALRAAAEPGADIAAVVSRGGRPDLARVHLGKVTSPTLLIVGELDHVVLDLNRDAQARMRCEVDLVIVPGATHLFGEPGALRAAAEHARDWFVGHLTGGEQSV